jgi:CO/xanthine dehydrogenase Mo-binding subunit
MAVRLKVNGSTHSVPTEPNTALLYVLRNDLALNGAKFGCGLAQCGTCTVIVDGTAAQYPILTMPDAPEVEVELINRPGERPMGAGEASSGPAAAAVANAFAHATGKRLRELPLIPVRVKAALG